jgi:hypothetical protein
VKIDALQKKVAANGNLLLNGAKLGRVAQLITTMDERLKALELADPDQTRAYAEAARASLSELAQLICPPSIIVRLDRDRQAILVDDAPIHLTSLEFKLVTELASARGRPVPKPALCAALGSDDGDHAQRNLAVHVSHVRRKLRQVTGRNDLILYKVGRGWFLKDSLADDGASPVRWVVS